MNTVIKTLDLSELPFQFEGASVRIKYLNKDNKGKMIIPTSENYLVEVYDPKDNEWKVWHMVQSIKIEIDVKTKIPKLEISWIDNTAGIC